MQYQWLLGVTLEFCVLGLVHNNDWAFAGALNAQAGNFGQKYPRLVDYSPT